MSTSKQWEVDAVRLLRNIDDPQLFISIGPWDSGESIEPHTLESAGNISSAVGGSAA